MGRSPGEVNGYPLQYSCLENPMDRGDWWSTVHEIAKSWTRLSAFHFHFCALLWPDALYIPFDMIYLIKESDQKPHTHPFFQNKRSQCNVCSWSLSFWSSFLRLKLKWEKGSAGPGQRQVFEIGCPDSHIWSGPEKEATKESVPLSCL